MRKVNIDFRDFRGINPSIFFPVQKHVGIVDVGIRVATHINLMNGRNFNSVHIPELIAKTHI